MGLRMPGLHREVPVSLSYTVEKTNKNPQQNTLFGEEILRRASKQSPGGEACDPSCPEYRSRRIKLKARGEGDSSVVMCLAWKHKDLRVWVSSTQVKGRQDCKDLSSQNWGVRDRATPGAD